MYVQKVFGIFVVLPERTVISTQDGGAVRVGISGIRTIVNPFTGCRGRGDTSSDRKKFEKYRISTVRNL